MNFQKLTSLDTYKCAKPPPIIIHYSKPPLCGMYQSKIEDLVKNKIICVYY